MALLRALMVQTASGEVLATIALKKKVLAYSLQVDSFAVELLSAQRSTQDEKHRIFLQACAVRMLMYFRAICTLVKADLNDPAGGVMRNLLEQHYVFAAVSKTPELMHRIAAEMSAESHKALTGLLKLDVEDRADELTDVRMQAALAELHKGSGFNAHDWAKSTGQTDSYHTLWRLLCDYAHGSPALIQNYLETDQAGEVVGIQPKIARVIANEFILLGARILLDAARALDTRPGFEQLRARFDYLVELQNELYAEYHQLRGDPLADLGDWTA